MVTIPPYTVLILCAHFLNIVYLKTIAEENMKYLKHWYWSFKGFRSFIFAYEYVGNYLVLELSIIVLQKSWGKTSLRIVFEAAIFLRCINTLPWLNAFQTRIKSSQHHINTTRHWKNDFSEIVPWVKYLITRYHGLIKVYTIIIK